MRVTIAVPQGGAASLQQTYQDLQVLALEGDTPLHWNEALKKAEGEAFLLLRGGDLLEPHAVDELVKLLNHSQGVVFAYGLAQGDRDSGAPTYEDGPTLLHGYSRQRRLLHGSGLLMRTQALRKIGGYPSHYKLLADQAAWLQLALEGWVGYCPQVVVKVQEREMACLDTLLHEEFLSLAESMAQVGRYRRAPTRMEGLTRLGMERIRAVLLRELQVGYRRQQSRQWLVAQLKHYSRYLTLRQLGSVCRLLASR